MKSLTNLTDIKIAMLEFSLSLGIEELKYKISSCKDFQLIEEHIDSLTTLLNLREQLQGACSEDRPNV